MLRLTWRFWWTALLMLTLFRLCLVVWQWPRVEAVDGFWPVMIGGLRIDLVMIGMMIAIPAGAGPFSGTLRLRKNNGLVVQGLLVFTAVA